MELTLYGIIRVCIWLVSLSGFMYQVSTILKMYCLYPFTVTVVEQLQKGILFPAVTICSENWINRSRLCAAVPHACVDGSQNVGDNNFRIEYDFDLQKDVALKPNEVMECYMRSNDPTCPAFTCFEALRRSYYRHPGHMCYTLDLLITDHRRDAYLACRSPWTLELTLNVIWSPEKTMSLQKENSYPILIHRPETTPPDKLASLIAEAGMLYVLSVTQQVTKRLPPPYASGCSDYLKEGAALEMGGYQSQDTCIQKCRMQLEHRFCGCVSPLYEYSAYFGKPACARVHNEKCQNELEKNNTFIVCSKRCRAPCDETTYDVRLTGMSLIPDSTNVGLNKLFIKIVEVFGYMGGYLGMWLGFSLFSILSGLEDKFERFLIRRAHALKKTPAPVRFNSTKQRIDDHKPRGTFEKRVTVKDLDTTLIGSGGSSQY